MDKACAEFHVRFETAGQRRQLPGKPGKDRYCKWRIDRSWSGKQHSEKFFAASLLRFYLRDNHRRVWNDWRDVYHFHLPGVFVQKHQDIQEMSVRVRRVSCVRPQFYIGDTGAH